MALTVRLPLRVEQELAEYCVKRRITKSEAVKRALQELLHSPLEGARYQRPPSSAGTRAMAPTCPETSRRRSARAFAARTRGQP